MRTPCTCARLRPSERTNCEQCGWRSSAPILPWRRSSCAKNYAVLCLALDWAGKYDDALAAGQQALNLDPNLLDAYAYLAEANADLNRTERALELAHKAVELDNNSWLAHRTLAYAYEHLGRYQNAASEYHRA